MKIEKWVYHEVVESNNPWEYFIIHWRFNRIELANIILKEGEMDINSHHYNYEMIRHLSSRKYSIRLFSSHLKFDHSKYFEKQ